MEFFRKTNLTISIIIILFLKINLADFLESVSVVRSRTVYLH